MRNYIIEDCEIDQDNPVEVMRHEVKLKMVKQLADKWNALNREMEMRSWRGRDERMDEDDYLADQLDETYQCTLECALEDGKSREEAVALATDAREKHEERMEAEWQKPILEMELIEEQLHSLGARLMRPYEHWNEDERYMEYMENRYEYDRGGYDY